MDLEKLAEPFESEDLEWRVQQCGKKKTIWAKLVPYVDSRAIMNRLDDVCGPGNWSDSYQNIQTKIIGKDGIIEVWPALVCTLSIKVGDEWVSKADGSDFTDIAPTKGGISDALKRAAVKWGIGRSLYTIGTIWAKDIKDGYAPDGAHTIAIVSKKDGINAWCNKPGITGNPVKATPVKKASGLETRRAKVLGRLRAAYQISDEQIMAAVNVEKIEDIGAEQVQALIGYGTSILNGDMKVQDVFSVTGVNKTTELNNALNQAEAPRATREKLATEEADLPPSPPEPASKAPGPIDMLIMAMAEKGSISHDEAEQRLNGYANKKFRKTLDKLSPDQLSSLRSDIKVVVDLSLIQ